MRLLRHYTWTPYNVWYPRCIVDEFLTITINIASDFWRQEKSLKTAQRSILTGFQLWAAPKSWLKYTTRFWYVYKYIRAGLAVAWLSLALRLELLEMHVSIKMGLGGGGESVWNLHIHVWKLNSVWLFFIFSVWLLQTCFKSVKQRGSMLSMWRRTYFTNY